MMDDHIRPPWLVALAACVCATLSVASFAQSAAAIRVRSLAASCAGCHGTEGRAVDGAAMPRLAGMPASLIASRLREFRNDSRTGQVMAQIAKGYDDAQIDALATYFERQTP
jgi:sulfide dehydrogenase cytochrome subunit